jgi:surface antigen
MHAGRVSVHRLFIATLLAFIINRASVAGRIFDLPPRRRTRAPSTHASRTEERVMNMPTTLLLAPALLSAVLAGCQEVRNEQVGQVVGGALGGLVGSQIGGGSGQIAAAVAGGLLGFYLGGNIGRTMDEVDRQRAYSSLERTPTGQTSSWQNPDTGNSYAVTPTRTYETQGQPCRDYTTEAWIDGQRDTVKGTACRQPDGTWRAS